MREEMLKPLAHPINLSFESKGEFAMVATAISTLIDVSKMLGDQQTLDALQVLLTRWQGELKADQVALAAGIDKMTAAGIKVMAITDKGQIVDLTDNGKCDDPNCPVCYPNQDGTKDVS